MHQRIQTLSDLAAVNLTGTQYQAFVSLTAAVWNGYKVLERRKIQKHRSHRLKHVRTIFLKAK